MATKTAKRTEEKQTPAETQDAPLIDTIDAAVKKLLQKAKERGFVTYDELNAALPSDEVSSEQIEDTMSRLSELGVNVVENEDSEEETPAPAENKLSSALEKSKSSSTPTSSFLPRNCMREPAER